ncbi:MAG: ATP-binding cassette domain-containing protein, partial [Chitinivibrionales bacterium]|nr:ATP-binding cassette domain-containing protein [Chitinivibrionales bacterium]MBD3395386.1 ATP-binding cassette domain-containing protein [Chitinivibrionales bacterium]
MVITTTSLSVQYPAAQRPALDAVDMELNEGECLLVSGPTGCGKSTLGLALCGAVPGVIPARVNGSISIDGHTSESIDIREASRTIGFLLQNIEHQIFTD